MNEEERYCLRWSNHQPTVMGVFDSLLRAETLVDVTLASEGKWLRAHRLVLSACSEYFQELLTFQPEKNAILYLRDVPFSHLEAIISFMYRGEVNVTQSELSNFIKTADSLRIRGLSDIYQNQPKVANQTEDQSLEPPLCRTNALSQSSEVASNCATDSANRSSNSSARRTKRLRSESPHEPVSVRSLVKNGFQEKRIPVVQLTPIDAPTLTDRRIPTTQSQSRNTAQVTLPNDTSTLSESVAPVLSDQAPMVSIPAPTMVGQSILGSLLCNVVPKLEIEEVDLDAVTLDDTAGGGEEDWSDLEGQGTSHTELEGFESQEGTSSSTANGAERNELRQGELLRETTSKSKWAPISIETGEKRFKCLKCDKHYKHKRDARRHCNYECNIEPRYSCPSCAYKSKRKESLRKHIISHHTKLDLPLKLEADMDSTVTDDFTAVDPLQFCSVETNPT